MEVKYVLLCHQHGNVLNCREIVEQKKDPGIPNTFPYKDQILGEIAEERRQVSCAPVT